MSNDSHGFDRRQFLTILGAATAATACSPRHGVDKIIPLLEPPAAGTPGLATYYRTICRECPAGCGVTARTREGRVVKLEGNPEHPINQGALCARGQAAIQGLYHPERPTGPLRRNFQGLLERVGWEQAIDEIAGALRVPARASGAIVLLSRSEPGSLGALQSAFVRAMGEVAERWVYEPFDPVALRTASNLAFGVEEIPVFRLDRAQAILSLGADFLETWLSPVEHARMLSEARSAPAGRARSVFMGPRLSLTAASADEWLATAPGGEREIALALCRIVLARRPLVATDPTLQAKLEAALQPFDPPGVEARLGLAAGTLERIGAWLAAAPSSVVLPPGPLSSGLDATGAALATILLNELLGNHGRTVLYGLDPAVDVPSSHADLQNLTRRMASGEVQILIVMGADPSATLPEDLGFDEALRKVQLSICLEPAMTTTARRATYVLPVHHFLEDWSDSRVRSGVQGLGQPMMLPVGDSRSAGDLLLQLGAKLALPALDFPFKSFETFWRDRTSDYAMLDEGHSGDLLAAVREGQQHGGFFGERAAASVTFQPAALAALGAPAKPDAREGALLSLLVAPDLRRYDGRSADKSWMQEIADPLTTVAWATPLEISARDASNLGVVDGDVVEVARGSRRAEFPICVRPGLGVGLVSLLSGDSNVLRLLPDEVDPLSGGRAFTHAKVVLRPTGGRAIMPKYGGSLTQQGTELARRVPGRSARVERELPKLTLNSPPAAGEHRWGMAIDLDRCTGCQACVAACYAENNLPVVGLEQAALGRAMAWIRIDRFFEKELPAAGGVSFLPMLCQQCGSAPCEAVCPVEATYHTDEGLNAQVYNRCVGTRYCANNCPYKVRVFNYSDHPWPPPTNLRLNPDVTVREKGVMEKCTFCVQRIRVGENLAQGEGRPVRDGEIVPACVQTCPGQAIVFGDLLDPKSAVAKASSGPRAYGVMEDLNTQPAIAYLARVDEEPS